VAVRPPGFRDLVTCGEPYAVFGRTALGMLRRNGSMKKDFGFCSISIWPKRALSMEGLWSYTNFREASSQLEEEEEYSKGLRYSEQRALVLYAEDPER